MKLLRKIIASFGIAFLVTLGAVQVFPNYDFTVYVVPLFQVGILALAVLTAESLRKDNLTMHDKNILMNGFLIVILGVSLFVVGSFVHLSLTSWSNGEIHWHADYEVLVEGEKGDLKRLDLIDPSNFCEEQGVMCKLNDRTGITKYHEHNDNRIHLEGVFQRREEATLSAYFDTFGGELSSRKLIYPTNNGTVKKVENKSHSLKIIVRSGVGGERGWKIIDNPSEYVISPYKRGANLDDIFIVYDDRSANHVKEQLRVNNGTYKGHGLVKQGDGF